jgi:multiple sugar transport system permease protein
VKRRTAWMPTFVLLLGAVYCLIPVLWVLVAATKGRGELFSTFTFLPGSGLWDNLAELTAYRDGVYWLWMLNSALYAGVGALLSAAVSAVSGYALAKFDFRGRGVIFTVILTGVLMPPITLAVPQYLLLAKVDLTGTYWSVLLPSILSPYGIYLARVYANAAVPDEVLEAARVDGARELRLFTSIAWPMMLPGLVTIFLFQFVAIWNNFLLPYVMLDSPDLFPITVAMYLMLNRGGSEPVLYSLAVAGSAVAIVPVIGFVLILQRFWRLDLVSGSIK